MYLIACLVSMLHKNNILMKKYSSIHIYISNREQRESAFFLNREAAVGSLILPTHVVGQRLPHCAPEFAELM